MRFLVTNHEHHICDTCGHLHFFVTRGCKPVAFDDIESATQYCFATHGASWPVALCEDPTEVVPLFPDVVD